jgi:hypothetical protein
VPVSQVIVKGSELVRTTAMLALLLIVLFFPFVIGQSSLAMSTWDAPSVVASGAYDQTPVPSHYGRTPDPGAPAWVSEPWLKLIQNQIWKEHNAPLWNPYSGYGTPLAAAMQPQSFYPLTILASLQASVWTYNLFIISRLLVAGVLMFLFARLFLARLPAIMSAITFMLTGYFIVFLNMPHLSVEILTPGLFFTFELILRRNSWASVAGAAGMIVLGLVGGMPESIFLSLAAASVYFVCRLIFVAEFRKSAVPLLGKFVAAALFGFSLSAFLLFPFVELLHLGHDVHQPSNVGGDRAGLSADGDFRATIYYLLPLLFGPINNSIISDMSGWTGMRSYWGVVPAMLAVAAVLSLVSASRRLETRSYRFLISFFFALLVLMMLKRFGSPIINWIGLLPVSEMVLYTKYQEPIVSFCVAMLAGVGFSLLIEKRAGWGIFAAAALVVAGFIYGVTWQYWPQVLQIKRSASFYYLSLSAGTLFVLAGLAIAVWFAVSRSFVVRRRLAFAFIGLLSLELVANYIVPAFYIYGALAPASRSPYKGAPFVDFLRDRNAEHPRLFARDGLLFPNWSGAFDLADVRSLDALYYRRYLDFIRNFLLAPGDNRRHGDLADRFTGAESDYAFSTAVERRFLSLSSVRYLISSKSYSTFVKIYDEEVKIYEVAQTLPRASLFSHVEILPDDQVLARLKESSFQPDGRVVLSRESLPVSDLAKVRPLEEPGSSAATHTAASIVKYQSRRVEIEADAGTTSLLMLTDSNYPGWYATVNGQVAPIVSANYLFRGVVVPPGKSKVEFVYEPRSFWLGAALSLVALFALSGLLLWERRRRVRRLSV